MIWRNELLGGFASPFDFGRTPSIAHFAITLTPFHGPILTGEGRFYVAATNSNA